MILPDVNEHGVFYSKDNEGYTLRAIIHLVFEDGEPLQYPCSCIMGYPTGNETRDDIVESGKHFFDGQKIGKSTPEYPNTIKWK